MLCILFYTFIYNFLIQFFVEVLKKIDLEKQKG